MQEIKENNYNLNISQYISTNVADKEINLKEVNQSLVDLEEKIVLAKNKHNEFLKELGLALLP